MRREDAKKCDKIAILGDFLFNILINLVNHIVIVYPIKKSIGRKKSYSMRFPKKNEISIQKLAESGAKMATPLQRT